MFRRSLLALSVIAFCLAIVSTPAYGQFGSITKAAKKAAEQETESQVERMVTDAVACAFNDPKCIEEAKASGQPVVLTDGDGNVITDEEGNPVSDPDEAAAQMERPGEGVWANYDFIPGADVLFVDDFEKDDVGDFPRRLEWLRGNMEIVEWQGRRLLRATGPNSQFAVLLDGGVPEQFTIEFDIHDPNTSGGTMIVTDAIPSNGVYKPGHFNFGHWRGSGIWRDGEPLSGVADDRIAKQLMTGRIMVDGAHAKVFMNEKRIGNAPRVELARGDRISFRFDARDDRPIYLGNIRIAAGGKDLYDKLAADGRVVTRGIFFDVNSDRIRPESTPTLEEIGDMLQDHPDLRIAIEGHTDSDGDDAYNQELSQRRAEAVRQFLVDAYQIDSGRLQAEGLGETVPVGDNATAEGKQQNRRVELVLLD